MHFQTAEFARPGFVGRPAQAPEKLIKCIEYGSPSLPFGQGIALPDIPAPTYLTAQMLVQQVAYTLSDRIWTYSPETFDLNCAVKSWSENGDENAFGYVTSVEAMQIRSGAASIALGYIFSQDFDMKKRYIPQSILASSSGLQYLRSALDQISRLYSDANPFIAHVAAVDYAGGAAPGLVTDYVSAMTLAEELGLAVVASFSADESQHMSLFATLLASVSPTIHLYDGANASTETTRAIGVLDQKRLYKNYRAILDRASTSYRKNADLDTKVARLLKGLNDEFGTDYGLFEYEGHDAPESVLIVFGTTESSLASQMSLSLNRDGNKVGVLRLRIYRPFLEEEFIKAIPKSVKTVGVLGQVCDALAVADSAIHSNLYGDVVLAMAFAKSWSTLPVIKEIKYPRGQVWAPNSIAAAFQLLSPKPLLRQGLGSSEAESWSDHQVADLAAVQEYTFWDLDESASVNAASVLGYCLSRDPSINISVKSTYDSMVQGGLRRTDIRKSKKSMDAAYPVEAADVIFVGDAIILQEADVLYGLKAGGSVVLKLSGVKDENLEKTLSSGFRKNLADKAARLFIYDPSPLVAVTNEQSLETYLTQLAFFRVSAPGSESFAAQKLAAINGSPQIFSDFLEDLAKVLHQVEVPEAWAVAEVDAGTPALPSNIDGSDVLPAERVEAESPNLLKDWKTVAKGLMFKEAFATSSSLRPDLTVKTHIVHVKENRRLTPLTYDRNIFHIEFDLGDSGLTYQIGEALGIHAQNDEKEVQDFIDYYKLEPDEIVEVPSREDPNILEHRTVYQALMQNVDIFGRPPKRFYESLAEFATDPKEKKDLLILGGLEGVNEFKRRAEVDTVTFADVLLEFSSAHPSFHDIIRIVDPMKRREYSIASCQKATPTSVALMIVTINWVDPKGRDRFGQATRYLNKLRPGAPVTVSIKPSVMKLPSKSTVPLIMAGLGTGLAPFRAFAQHRAWEKEQGLMIGPVLLYMGSRHQREEYCYGEEWEAYQAAGVITLLGRAFSRDQPHKIYIQDRMRETMNEIIDAYFGKEGSFYLCGPTWPVPDVQNVLEDAVVRNSRRTGKRVEPRKEIERLKDAGRYVLEVY